MFSRKASIVIIWLACSCILNPTGAGCTTPVWMFTSKSVNDGMGIVRFDLVSGSSVRAVGGCNQRPDRHLGETLLPGTHFHEYLINSR